MIYRFIMIVSLISLSTCSTSGGRSGQTLDKLKEMGFEEIYELAGGYGDWEE